MPQGLLRLAQGGFGIGQLAVLDRHRHAPQPRHDITQLVVGLGVGELPIDRPQAEIVRNLRREFLGRNRERIERSEQARLRFSVERKDAALLDQRARQRLDEHALGQLELERGARAFIAGLVTRGQSQHDLRAGPGMIGQVLGGLACTVSRAQLRQHQREIGRAVERTRHGPVRTGFFLQRKIRLRRDDTVVVLDLVGELQRSARLRLGILA